MEVAQEHSVCCWCSVGTLPSFGAGRLPSPTLRIGDCDVTELRTGNGGDRGSGQDHSSGRRGLLLTYAVVCFTAHYVLGG